jgi:excisionase family DNA binding protein
MSNNVMPAAFSVPQAAAYISISRATLYTMFKSGQIRRVKIGYRTLVLRADLDALLAGLSKSRGVFE